MIHRAKLLAAGLALALGAAPLALGQEVVPPADPEGGMVLIDPEKPLGPEIEALKNILDEDMLETIAKADQATVYKLAVAGEDDEIEELDDLEGYSVEEKRELDDLDREALKRVIVNRETWGREVEDLENEEIDDLEAPFHYAIKFVRGDDDETVTLFVRRDEQHGAVGLDKHVNGLLMWTEDGIFADDERYFEVDGKVLFPYLEALHR